MKSQNSEQNQTNATGAVDIVAEANYSPLSETYNQQFRSWRNRETNDYAFRCRKREKEAVYVESKGYHAPDPATEERRAMIRVNMAIGMAMLVYLLLENLLTFVLMGAVQLVGFDVGYSYSDGTVYGHQTTVLVILMLQTLLKYLIPLLMLRATFRMPRRVGYHWKLDAPREMPASLAVTLVVFAITNTWLLFSPANILSSSTLGTAYYTVSYMRPAYQMIYMLFQLLVVSIFTELLVHGEILHVLRQFGDWYAVIMTALLSVCMSHGHVTVLMELTFSIVAGIAVLRSGSLLPSIVNRIVYHVLLFVMFALEISPNRVLHHYRPLLMLAILLIGALGCAILIRPSKNNPALLKQKHYLTIRERLRIIMHLGPLSIIFCLCIVLMLIEVFF